MSLDSEYIPSRTIATLGAVTLTLKATGWALLFVTAKLRLTVTVSGPGKKLHGSNHPKSHYMLENLLLNPRALLGVSETDILKRMGEVKGEVLSMSFRSGV